MSFGRQGGECVVWAGRIVYTYPIVMKFSFSLRQAATLVLPSARWLQDIAFLVMEIATALQKCMILSTPHYS